jgi:uncharacterized protein
MTAKFEVYKDKSGDYRWRLIHTNAQIIANSGEGYTTKVNAAGGTKSVIVNAPNTPIEDKTT